MVEEFNGADADGSDRIAVIAVLHRNKRLFLGSPYVFQY